MYSVSKEFTFDSAHRLKYHDGKCRDLHGHTYRLIVTLTAARLISHGPVANMIIDFGDLKRMVGAIVDACDHKDLNSVFGIDQPTAEFMAREIFMLIDLQLSKFREKSSDRIAPGTMLHSVKLYETPTSFAEWTR